MNVRILEPNDLQQWKNIRLQALQTEPEFFGGAYEDEIEFTDQQWLDILKKSDIFGVFEGTFLMGIGGLSIVNLKKLKHKGTIFGVYTHPDHRGQGVASALLKHIINYGRIHVSQFHLACITKNMNALNLYYKKGFKIYGTEPSMIKVDDAFFDAHWMVLELNQQA